MARHVPTLTSNIKHLYFDTPSLVYGLKQFETNNVGWGEPFRN